MDMDRIDHVLLSPFKVVRAPELKLTIPKILFNIPPMLIFAAVFLSYFIVMSGVIYDIITETPSIGGYRDPYTGVIKPQAILPGRINGQYIIEGLTTGFLFCVGALGFILLDQATKRSNKDYNLLMILAGTTLILIAYNVCIVFIRKKVGNYLR